MNMKKLVALACMALAFIMAGSVLATDNVGTGGTITYTDAGGALVGAPVTGGDVIHTFTSSGTLNIPVPASANVLVVAGGGGGGGSTGGGGGAGGYIYSNLFAVVGGSNYTVTVGAGGNGGNGTAKGANGTNSVFGTLTAVGGGGGASNTGSNPDGLAGGSGGGASFVTANGTGGAGTSGQGQSGGGPVGTWGTGSIYTPGGGGGYGAAGINGTSQSGGAAGGAGATNSISGTATVYAGGGGGGVYQVTGNNGGGLGGSGIGGRGGCGPNSQTQPTSGAVNTGSGGGGQGGNGTAVAGSGGSGIVIVRYPYDAGSLSVSVTSPVNGQQFLPGSSVTATVTVASGTMPYTVTFYTNGVSAWSTNSALTSLFTIDLGALADGTYTNYATVTDSVSSNATSATNTFTVAPDTTAPTPNPMTFAVNPVALSPTSIIMMASTATDVLSPPVEYFFANTTNSSNSGWTTSTVWTNTGLTMGTTYGYQVKARDAVSNETAFSAVFKAVSAVPTVTWDANNTGAGQTDGAGTWLSANQWWNGVANCDWNNSIPYNAIIGVGGAGGTITLGAVSAGSVTFTNFTSTYTLSGGSLTNNGGITVAATTAGSVTLSSTLAGAGGIVMSGAGTLTLNGAGNTFTGATTVNAGTLQVSSAGAFNNIARTVTINNGGTASVTVGSAVNGASITINSGGTLAANNVTSAYSGSTINLNGGTLRFDSGAGVATPYVVGGNIAVGTNSTLNTYSTGGGHLWQTIQYGTLDFTGDGYQVDFTPTGANGYQQRTMTSMFVGSTISHSGKLHMTDGWNKLELNNTAIRVGKKITKDNGSTFTVSGSLGVAMLGGAELLGTNAFTMISADTVVDTSTLDSTAGLWSRSAPSTTTIAATLEAAGSMGSIGGSSGISFASEDAAYVSLTGLTVSTTCDLFLKLADPAKQATVMTQLGKNPAFSSLASLGADQVQFKFTAPAATSYFAWDNYHTTGDWCLGGDLTYVGLSAWTPPTDKDCLWNGGGGTDVKWSTAANWALTPVTGDTLAFGTPGAGGATLVNDIVGGSFASLQFQSGAPAFTLNGNSVTLTGKGLAPKVIMVNNSGNIQTVNLPIALGANGVIDANSAAIVIGGDISGDFILTKIGAGTLTLSGANNTYIGGTVINAGAVVIDNTSTTTKLGAAGKSLTMGGGSLDLGGISQTVGAVSVTAAAPSGDTVGNGNLTATSYAVSATGDVAISANLGGGTAGLAKSGASILTLTGSGNTYAGATTISEGTLKLGVANAIPHGVGKGDVAVGGTLDLNGLNQTVNGLTGAGAVTNSNSTAAILTVGDNNISSSFPGAINDGIGAVALEKIGTGMVTLSGTNGYTGDTTVSAGTLQFNSAGAIGGSGRSVTVSSGGTVAAGYAINNAFLNRLAENTNTCTVALAAASGNNLDFNTSTGAILPNARLGATGAFTYSGTLTPNGTTYRLGGGGGTLTVSSSTLGGSGNSLMVTGPGTVVLSGSANTFDGATTVNAATLQISSTGAFNSIARTVTINNGGTVSVTVSSAVNGASITINSGGTLAAYNVTSAYSGSTITLNGGTLVFSANTTTPDPRASGGTIAVSANSILNSIYSSSGWASPTYQYGTLDFIQDGYQLEVTDAGGSGYQPAWITSRFVGSTISHSATIKVTNRTTVELNNTAIRAGKTITKNGSTFTVSGSLGVAMLGGAELLGTNSFTMISADTVVDTSTLDSTAGLWAKSGTTTIAATLEAAGSKGSIGGSSDISFAAEDAGYVSLTGLTPSKTYPLNLKLANAGNRPTVLAQLAKNPAFTNIIAIGTDRVLLEFTASAVTNYFAWDNVHTSSADWYLGSDLINVSLTAYPGTIILFR
jgi:autotransporter-associated beta strand protein